MLPGGGNALDVVLTVLTIAFFAAIAFLAYRLFRQYRFELETLEPDSGWCSTARSGWRS